MATGDIFIFEMTLSAERIVEIRDECFADDVEIPLGLEYCSEVTVREFFESGGVTMPRGMVSVESNSSIPSGEVQPDSPPRQSPTATFQRIKVFGDSHVNTFISVHAVDGGVPLLAYPYTAGSAMGLRHADSITGYRTAIESDVKRGLAANDAIVLKFGQVDCDFVYFLKLADNPSLDFDTFAQDSVRKYMSFVDDCLKAPALCQRDQLLLMTPFATCVSDANLRESLCTLPFMDAAFKQSFSVKLEHMTLPDLRKRTEHGTRYSALLRTAAAERGLRCIDIHEPMLSKDTCVNRLLNPDRNHHLVDDHIPLLIPVLEAAFGGRYTRAGLPDPVAIPPVEDSTHGQHHTPSAEHQQTELQGALKWIELLMAARSGRIPLRLKGHAVGSFRMVQNRFGPPLPVQLALPQAHTPGFATWMMRFDHESGRGVSAEEGSSVSAAARVGLVRLLGRFRNYDDEHAWLVECSEPALIDLVRDLLEYEVVAEEETTRRPYEVPPLSFHLVLQNRAPPGVR